MTPEQTDHALQLAERGVNALERIGSVIEALTSPFRATSRRTKRTKQPPKIDPPDEIARAKGRAALRRLGIHTGDKA